MSPKLEEFRLKYELKSLLERKGLRVSDLARATGVPKQSLCDWLAGASPRKLEHLRAVAVFLGVTIDELCFGKKLPYDTVT